MQYSGSRQEILWRKNRHVIQLQIIVQSKRQPNVSGLGWETECSKASGVTVQRPSNLSYIQDLSVLFLGKAVCNLSLSIAYSPKKEHTCLLSVYWNSINMTSLISFCCEEDWNLKSSQESWRTLSWPITCSLSPLFFFVCLLFWGFGNFLLLYK